MIEVFSVQDGSTLHQPLIFGIIVEGAGAIVMVEGTEVSLKRRIWVTSHIRTCMNIDG